MFESHPERPRVLLVGAGGGIEPIAAFAQRLLDSPGDWKPLVLLSAEPSIAFRPRPSTILVSGMPEGTIACMPTLDEMGIASRLASVTGYPGCYDGEISDLAATWLSTLDRTALDEVAIIAGGPAALLEAIRALAHRFAVPAQLLEFGG